jgi:hypothetical protein
MIAENSSKMKAKAFDTIIQTNITVYKALWRFNGVLCPYLRLRPYLLKQTVDDYIQTKDDGLLFYITLMMNRSFM